MPMLDSWRQAKTVLDFSKSQLVLGRRTVGPIWFAGARYPRGSQKTCLSSRQGGRSPKALARSGRGDFHLSGSSVNMSCG
jgi:hypothetical protein